MAIAAAATSTIVAGDNRLAALSACAPMGLRSLSQFGQRQARRTPAPVAGDKVSASYRIAIVGSGPAGLSAAARAAALGLSHVLLEKAGHLSDTIYKYQKGKHVMATPAQLVLRSDMAFEAGKREKVLAAWDAGAEVINVRLDAEVRAIEGGE